MKNFKIILLLAAIIVANNINASQTRQFRLKQPATQIKAPTTTTQPSISEAMQTANMLYDAKSKKFIQNNITKYIQAMKSENPLYTNHELGRQVFEEILKTLKAAHGSQIDTNQLKEALNQSINNYFYAEEISLPETLSTEAKVTTEPKTPTRQRRLGGKQVPQSTVAQEKPTTPAYQPKSSSTATTTPTRRIRGQQAATAQPTKQLLPAEKVTILPSTLSTLSSADKATAILIYDENTKSLKEHGIEIYIKNEKNRYPAIRNNLELITIAYDDAARILKEIRKETILDRNFSNKLKTMISNAVYKLKLDYSGALASAGKTIAQPSELILQPEQLMQPTLSSADKATAILIYDEDKQLLKEDGIETYIKLIRKTNPDISSTMLKAKTYNNAVAILQKVRNEVALNKSFADQLLRMISDIVDSPQKESIYEQLKSTIEPSPQKALIILKEKRYNTFNDFVDDTANNIAAFWYKGQLQPDWFYIAVAVLRYLGFSGENLKTTLQEAALALLKMADNTKAPDQNDIDAINFEIDRALTEI